MREMSEDIHTQIDGLRAGRYTHLAARYLPYEYRMWDLSDLRLFLYFRVPSAVRAPWTPIWSVSSQRYPVRSALCESEEEARETLRRWIAEDLRTVQYPHLVSELIRAARHYGVPLPETLVDNPAWWQYAPELRAAGRDARLECEEEHEEV